MSNRNPLRLDLTSVTAISEDLYLSVIYIKVQPIS